MEFTKDIIKGSLWGIIIIGLISIGTLMGMFVMPEEKKAFKLDIYRDQVIEHNLEVDWYNEPTKEWASDWDLNKFHTKLKENYEYTEIKDCKYWSLIWALYFEKHEYSWQFVDLQEDRVYSPHVFVVAFNESTYCTADQFELNCYNFR